MNAPSSCPDLGALGLRQLVDAVEQPLALLSADGRVIDANRAALALAGADLRDRAFATADWLPRAQDREAVAAALAGVPAAGLPARIHVRPVRDGETLDVELRFAPVLQQDATVAIAVSGRDVTAELACERSEHVLDGIVRSVPDAIVTIDDTQRIRMANPGAETAFGYAAHEMIGQPLSMLLPESVRPKHAGYVREFGGSEDEARFMNQRAPVAGRRRDGSVFPAEVTIARARIAGEVLYTAVLRDISERSRAQRELAQARQHEDAILRSVADGVVGVDREGRTTFANPAAARLLGYRVHELIGRDLHALIHHSRPDGGAYPVADCPIWSAIHHGVAMSQDDVYWRADGTALPVECATTPFHVDGRVEGAVVVFRDGSARQRAQAELLQLSLVDELTGLYNRRGFMLHANRSLERAADDGHEVVLAFFDMDRFKAINDAHGHLAGDQALREVATLLRRTLRREDVLGRFGGDEFVALITRPPGDAPAVGLQARIEAQLAHRNAAPDTAFALAMSVGTVRLAPGERRAIESLLADADAALYRAKRDRRGA
ncbi:MAG TPA: PAS domain S-box protein [Lysobacter sp.]|nr:PAS domain S-box protein [Lysobacter sp.]